MDNKISHFHIQPLDGIRGMAVLMVMFFHYNLISYETVLSGLTSFVKFGQTGVTLFFVLSGFLITRILIKAKHSQNYFTNFYLKRTLRIFPLYYFFLLLTYYVLPLFEIGSFSSFSNQVPFYLFYQNIAFTFHWPNYGPNHYWSLAVEEHFYLFWPLVMYFFSIKNCHKVLLAIVCIAVISRIILLSNNYGDFYFTLCRMDAIAIGCYIAFQEYDSNYLIEMKWKKHLVIAIIAITAFGYLWIHYREKSNLYVQVIKDIPYYYFYYLLIMLVVSKSTILIQDKIKLFFSNRFLVFAGKISFSLYIYHVLCYSIISKLEIGNIYLSLFACFAFAFAIASLSYYFFEMPFLKLKQRLHN